MCLAQGFEARALLFQRRLRRRGTHLLLLEARVGRRRARRRYVRALLRTRRLLLHPLRGTLQLERRGVDLALHRVDFGARAGEFCLNEDLLLAQLRHRAVARVARALQRLAARHLLGEARPHRLGARRLSAPLRSRVFNPLLVQLKLLRNR